jgi:phospholipid/cholesterol/gamma-HCH transport system substrate-binding protein
MKNTLETRLGLFVALAATVAFLLITSVGGLDRFRAGLHLHALFSTVQELKPGDRIKMGGVEIGRVEKIQIAEDKVKVTMKLRPDAVVRTDSVATIKSAGLMGQNFVAIDFGTPDAKPLMNNQIVNTAEQPDLNAVMSKLDNVASGIENITKSFAGDKIDNLLGPLTDLLKQNSEPLTASIANMKSISTQIAEGKGTVGKLIYDDALFTSALDTVTNLQSNIQDTTEEIKLALADARKIIDNVNAGQGSLGLMVKDEAFYREATASMTNLKEILQKINQGDGTVGKLVNDQEFYENAKLTLQKVDKATEGLEDQGPLSVIGILVNSGLF